MYRFFLFFSIMERIRKGSDLPKKNWGSPSIQQKYSQIKLPQRSPALYFVEFQLGARACAVAMGANVLKSMNFKLFLGIVCYYSAIFVCFVIHVN